MVGKSEKQRGVLGGRSCPPPRCFEGLCAQLSCSVPDARCKAMLGTLVESPVTLRPPRQLGTEPGVSLSTFTLLVFQKVKPFVLK